MNILDEIIKKGDLVFDVGCNTGGKSDIYIKLGASVVGFEPQPQCIKKILEKFKDHKNFKLEPIGLGSSKGVGIIYESNAHTISSMSVEFINTTKDERFKDYSWVRKFEIAVDTLDHMIEKHGIPAFIKIDVEGYEYEVLSGLHTPIDTISIEFTPELCGKAIKCIEYLDELNHNKTLFNYGCREEAVFTFDKWVDKYDIIKFLESIDDYAVEFGDVYIKKL